jgi:PAS domain S-box-containing protein
MNMTIREGRMTGTEIQAKSDNRTPQLADPHFNQAVLDALPANVAVLNSDGVIVAVNKSWQQFAVKNGDPDQRASGIGSNYLDVAQSKSLFFCQEARAACQGIRDVLNGTAPAFSLEYPCHSPDQKRWFQMQVTPLLGAVPTMAVVLHIEVTERKAAELQAGENEERFRLLVEGVKDHAIIMLDPSGNVVTWNAGAEQVFGYKAEEIIGRNYACYFSIEDVTSGKPKRNLDQAIAQGSFHEEGWRVRKDGSRFWSNGGLTVLNSQSGHLRGFVKITRDLTEQNRLEALFESVFEHAIDSFIVIDVKGTILLFNEAAEKLFGYSAYEAVGKNVRSLMPEPFGSNHDTYIADYVRTDQAQIVGTGRYVEGQRKDGSTFPAWLDVSEFFLNDERHFIGIVRDMTEQQRTKEEMQRLAAIVQSSDDAIVGMSLSGKIHSWNQGAEQLFGYSAIEALGQPFSILAADEPVGTLMDRLAQIANGEHAKPYESVRVRKDGKKVDVAIRFSPIWGNKAAVIGVSAICRDISERKKLEEQLRQSQKMEAIGQLAGGVAHDFNNLLTIMNGYTDLVAGSLTPESPNRKMLQEVSKAGERAAALTRQLLAFGRKQVLEPRVLDLNAVVTNIERMLQRLIGEDVELSAVLAPVLRRVNVDQGQIEQIIINLAVNARDAMPTGGKLTIETKNVDLPENDAVSPPTIRPNRYVRLAVSDTGCGMTPEIQARIFEPFFTTKGPGKGTGLGLATVYGIVKQSGGHIDLASAQGQGTTFKIYFPAVDKRESTVESRQDIKLKSQGSETILLVEDEDAVRTVSRSALKAFGYHVLEASRPAEAIRLCEQHPGPISLVVMDLVMPEMGGRAVAERIAKLRPRTKVLFVSGYSEDAVARHGVRQPEVAFLQKPFTPSSLAGKVRQMLDKPL